MRRRRNKFKEAILMKYDAIIIGFGQGANALVQGLTEKDWKVAIIEKDAERYGGSCINIGCIPTKILEHDARNGVDYVKAVERRNKVTSDKRQSQKEAVENNDNVNLYTGTACFVDNYRVKVETSDEVVELTSDHIMISTGSEPVMPPIDGLDDTENVYTSTILQQQKELPKSLGIMGGGYIGLEFASIYSAFGSKVTMIDTNDTFMEGKEPEVASEVKRVLEEKGITIHNGTSISKVENDGNQVLATTDSGEEFAFDALLVATGRKPHTSSLNLDNTDIELNEKEGIQVNTRLQTSVKGVYAFGDVKGEEQFTYITLEDAKVILSDLLENDEKTLEQRENVPYSIFMDPSFAQVGLTEQQAKDEGYEILTNTTAVADTVRSAVIDDERGLYKAVVDKNTEKILGVTLFGDQAHELVNYAKLAMDEELSYTVLRDKMITHPVMMEIFNTLFMM